jgi:hypothetical protein
LFNRRRVYDDRDPDAHDPRDALMHDLDLPRGEECERWSSIASRLTDEGR